MTKKNREKYIGVKYEAIRLGSFIPSAEEKKKIKELISAGKELGKLGFKDKNGGNLSLLSRRGVIIKATGAHPYKLKEKDFSLIVAISPTQVFYLGDKEPSSEARLHGFVYKKNKKIKAIIHAHDFLAVYSSKKIKGIAYIKEVPYGTIESARLVSQAAKKYYYLIQKNHGVSAFASNLKNCLKILKQYHEKFKGA